MKKFKLVIIVETKDDFKKGNFVLRSHDVIDGFELTRTGFDITDEFKMNGAHIDSVIEMETDERKIKIKEIKRIIGDWGGASTSELNLESSPCLKSIGNGKNNISELIEYFYYNGVTAVTYHDEVILCENVYDYEELSDDIIDEISEIMENYDVDMEKTQKRIKD